MITNKDLYPKLAEIKHLPRKQVLVSDIEGVKSLDIVTPRLDIFEGTDIVATIDYENEKLMVYNVATSEKTEIEKSAIAEFISSL